MDDDKINLTKGPEEMDWKSATSISDEMIKDYCSTILANPAEYDGDKMLYTEQQIFDIFRLGVSTITSTEIWKRFVSVQKYWGRTVYRIMRNMNVGETKLFPFDRWNAARATASKLKESFGCVYKVTKKGETNSESEIQVVRLK